MSKGPEKPAPSKRLRSSGKSNRPFPGRQIFPFSSMSETCTCFKRPAVSRIYMG